MTDEEIKSVLTAALRSRIGESQRARQDKKLRGPRQAATRHAWIREEHLARELLLLIDQADPVILATAIKL